MACVRCVTMQKDEGLLLDAWLRYYGYHFGFENLEVFDNGSTDGLTLALLDLFEAVGVTIHRQHTARTDFERKGDRIAARIAVWDEQFTYDFALPCDIDEFLAVYTRKGLSCERGAIAGAMDALLGTQSALRLHTSLINVPGRPGWFHPELFQKGFLPRGSILSLDSGYHVPQSHLAEGFRDTDFTYLHYHNKPYDVVQAHTRRKLHGRVNLSDREALRDYRGAGAHMTKDLLMSRQEYLEQFDDALTLRFAQFPALLAALGTPCDLIVGNIVPIRFTAPPEVVRLRLPPQDGRPGGTIEFDGPGYLEDHPDVAAATGCGLPHYLYHGFREDRRLREPARELVVEPAVG